MVTEHIYSVVTREEIERILPRLQQCEGPVLLELRVKINSRADLGRPTTTPLENKKHFIAFLSNE